MDEQHIADRSSGNGEQHLPFPAMQRDGQSDGDQLRNAVAAAEDADIFQTVDSEPPKIVRLISIGYQKLKPETFI